MLFEVKNPNKEGVLPIHCGVLEFTAEEGTVFLPYWVRAADRPARPNAVTVELTVLPSVRPSVLAFYTTQQCGTCGHVYCN